MPESAGIDLPSGVDFQELRELQLATLAILKDVAALCERHNIAYYLVAGTLLGAVRHRGFIPWDDDIDIMMFREDYNKFLSVAGELGEQYTIQAAETGSKYWLLFTKVRLLAPKPFADTMLTGITKDNGLFIDIFVGDYVPHRRSLAQFMVSRLLFLVTNALWVKYFPGPSKGFGRFIATLLRRVPMAAIRKTYLWGAQLWDNKPREYCTFYSYSLSDQYVAPVSYFGKPKWIEFEGAQYPIPNRADRVLNLEYGDYRQLPPVEKRKPLHGFKRA